MLTKNNQLTAWLLRHGLTAYGAAPILGLSYPQLYRIERGQQPISATLARLLDMLDRHGIPNEWRDTS